MYGQYDKYTLLNTSWENIYQECANIEFQKARIWPPNLHRSLAGRINQSIVVSIEAQT